MDIEAVAHRAGASKATIYRRWGSAGELLVDAMDASFRPFPLPGPGDTRSALLQLLGAAGDLLQDQGFPRVFAAFVDAAERDPRLQGLHARLTAPRREPIREVLARAAERGEISPGTDTDLVIDMLSGPLFYRRFVAHRAPEPGYLAALVDQVPGAIGFTPGGGPREPPAPLLGLGTTPPGQPGPAA